MRVILVQPRAHHRAQHERNDARHQHGAGQSQRKLAEQHPRQAAQETDRQVNRNQRERHGDDRQGNLTCADDGRVVRRLAIFNVPMHVLHHDDGIVHHQPDGYDHGQQRQQVDGEAHCPDQEQHGGQRKGNRNDGNRHDAKRSQEQQNHQDDDDGGFDEGRGHLLQRFPDVLGQIGIHEDRQVCGQTGFQLGDFLLDACSHLQRIGARRLVDRDEDRFLAAGVNGEVVGFAGELHGSHVTEPHAPILVLADHDLGKLLRLLHIGLRIYAGPNQLAVGHACSGNVVVAPNRIVDVRCRDAEGRHPGRV